MEFPLKLKAYAERVDDRLSALLPDADAIPTELHQAMRYSALAPGKRLRPALAMATAEALGKSSEVVLDAACAIELVHAFSLIHDDLPALDNDALRRGRPTCHVKFGEAVAILAGDALFSFALQVLAAAPAPADRVVRSIRSLTAATNALVEGETVDILSEGKPVEAATLELIHRRKTGALIAASCEIGALMAEGTESQVALLREYGECVGLAFQIADDILNETATPEQLGKAAGSDRERQKATYPALYGLEASRKAALDAVEQGTKCLTGLPDAQLLTELAQFSVSRLS